MRDSEWEIIWGPVVAVVGCGSLEDDQEWAEDDFGHAGYITASRSLVREIHGMLPPRDMMACRLQTERLGRARYYRTW